MISWFSMILENWLKDTFNVIANGPLSVRKLLEQLNT